MTKAVQLYKLLFTIIFTLYLYLGKGIAYGYFAEILLVFGLILLIKQRKEIEIINNKSYLLLKDIFPQNAVDMGLMKKEGILHKYFRRVEKKLYTISDHIGCMSPANVEYVLQHNPEVDKSKVEENPNTLFPLDLSVAAETKIELKKKYNFPIDSILLLTHLIKRWQRCFTVFGASPDSNTGKR